MKKLACTLLVAMVTMASMAFAQVIGGVGRGPYFTITNKTTNQVKQASLDDFNFLGCTCYEVNFSSGVYNGDQIEITYNTYAPTPQLTWYSAWIDNPLKSKGTGLTVTIPVENVPSLGNTLLVKCNYQGNGGPKDYLFYIMNVHSTQRITVKNSGASEVQVSYEDYEKVSSGQRATIALYDIYGNPVSTGYLDNLGMGTLSTKGKSGIYIVKVTTNDQVIFNQRIQVK